MEHFLTAEEVIEKHINKSSLIFAFISGQLTAYDRNSFDPIDGKELFDFFKHLGNVFYLVGGPFFNEADHPLYQEDRYLEGAFLHCEGIWTDPTTKIRYSPSKIDSRAYNRVPWVQLYKEINYEIELARKDPDYFEEWKASRFTIFWEQVDEIQDGWGAKQAEEIIKESVFKESDLIRLISTNENQEVTISIEQLAKILDTAKNTVKSWTKKGLLPDKQVGDNKKILLLPESILKWMQQQAHKAEKNNENAALHKWNNRIEKFKKWLETNK